MSDRFAILTETEGGFDKPFTRIVPDGQIGTNEDGSPVMRSDLSEAERQARGFALYTEEAVAKTHDPGPPTDTLNGSGYARSYPAKAVKGLSALRAIRKTEANSECTRRFNESWPLPDRWHGMCRAILQIDNDGVGGGTVGVGIKAGIAGLNDLIGFRDALRSSIDGMNQSALLALDVTDDSHWEA